MIAVVFMIALLALSIIPQLWVTGVIKRHARERSDFPGTGGEFARHLLDGMKLHDVKVERTDLGDHYDPAGKAVRLSEAHLNGRSLSAVVIAAHEVGHAMQDATGYGPLRARVAMAQKLSWIDKIFPWLMGLSLLLTAVGRSPALLLIGIAIGLFLRLIGVAMLLLSLPSEFDASFRRALPVLKAGQYISDRDMGAARHILTAAALTYVAAAAMSLINVLRWIRP
jgi:uncharacterized protein